MNIPQFLQEKINFYRDGIYDGFNIAAEIIERNLTIAEKIAIVTSESITHQRKMWDIARRPLRYQPDNTDDLVALSYAYQRVLKELQEIVENSD